MNKKITKSKAQKRVNNWREHLQYWREHYVWLKRQEKGTIDIHLNALDEMTIREYELKNALQEIKEAKEHIAKYERYAM